MDPSRAGNLRSDRARLHSRSNDPLLLRSRPTSASLHRRDHFSLRLGHRSSPRITPRPCPNHSAPQGGPHRVLTHLGRVIPKLRLRAVILADRDLHAAAIRGVKLDHLAYAGAFTPDANS